MDRLGKFFALVKNEYIKIYKKTSSRILLIIFFAVCLCFAPIARVINNIGMKEAGTIDYDYSSITKKQRNKCFKRKHHQGYCLLYSSRYACALHRWQR